MKYLFLSFAVSVSNLSSSFFSNLDPAPYTAVERFIKLPDTLYAHQRIFIPQYNFQNAQVSILYDGNIFDAQKVTGESFLTLPSLSVDTASAVIEIKSRFIIQTDTVIYISERWLEFFLDPDLQFSILWEGSRPLVYSLVSSGREQSPTTAAHTKIFDKKPSSEFYDGGLMRWWMSIQRTHNVKVITDSGEERFFPVLENGTHAPLSGTYHMVGRQASHGCIRNPLAKVYYDNLDVGDRVEMHYRNSGTSYRHERINGAYRYITWDPVLSVDSTLVEYVEKARMRIESEFGIQRMSKEEK
ncbi:L,D-transpeptidase [candidate division WOR-3 bacterium]|nr:L,D-transpeptidase [candidate division WOR-3 bacterium]